MKILSLIFIIALSIPASAQWANIAPNCTPDAVTLQESFGDGGVPCWSGGPSKCTNTWSIGAGAAQSITTTPNTPPLYTACANSLKMVQAASTPAYINTPLSSKIVAGQVTDITFTINITAFGVASFNSKQAISFTTDANLATGPVIVYLHTTDGVNAALQAIGSTTATDAAITQNAWHTVRIHLAAGAAASSLTVDGGSAHTFTENAQGITYAGIGDPASVTDTATYYIGNMFINSNGSPQCGWPQTFMNFNASTNGTTVTAALLTASNNGGNGTWSLSASPATGFTFATAAQKALVTSTDICGTYQAGSDTLGTSWDLSVGTHVDLDYTPVSIGNTYSMGFWWQTNLAVTDAFFYTVGFIGDVGGVDYAGPEENGDTTQLLLHMETAAGNVGFTLTSVANASAGSTVYTGTITGGAANALAGQTYQIGGFATGANNGTFLCTASTATTLTLSNASGASETHAATATASILVSPGTWYWITTQMIAGGVSSMAVYDSTCTQIGATITHAGTNAALPNLYRIGRVGSEAGTPAGKTFFYDGVKFDYVKGTFPLKC